MSNDTQIESTAKHLGRIVQGYIVEHKDIIEGLRDLTNNQRATIASLRAEVKALAETIVSLRARIETLEGHHDDDDGGPEPDPRPDPEPPPSFEILWRSDFNEEDVQAYNSKTIDPSGPYYKKFKLGDFYFNISQRTPNPTINQTNRYFFRSVLDYRSSNAHCEIVPLSSELFESSVTRQGDTYELSFECKFEENAVRLLQVYPNWWYIVNQWRCINYSIITGGKNPVFCLMAYKGKLWCQCYSTDSTGGNRQSWSGVIGELDTAWHKYVLTYRPTTDENGRAKIEQDGTTIFDHKGPCTFAQAGDKATWGPQVRLGAYGTRPLQGQGEIANQITNIVYKKLK